jgi:catechol 2,3-dioxygenase-like lactoylglutathione lyase family enzyme
VTGTPHLLFDHTAIVASNREASDRFHGGVLGAEVVDVGFGAWAYRFGTAQVVAIPPDGPVPASLRVPLAPGAAHVCLVWPGPIEEAIAHLERHGIPLAERPSEHVGGRGRGTSIYIHDPDEMLLELISYT